MDFYTFVEEPLLWAVFIILAVAIFCRLSFFFYSIIKSARHKDSQFGYIATISVRSLAPYHKGTLKMPLYAALRYIFHVCLVVVPIWLSGHISLWEDSRLEISWTEIPDELADWMTIVLIGLAIWFIIRRFLFKEIRAKSSARDYTIILITALPFLTGYFLTHGTIDSIPFFGENITLIHMLTGEAMILMAAFLFCRTRMNTEKCVGCASCEIQCPTGTLETKDDITLKQRIFTYSHYQCICCGECVKTCPEDAAELRHEVSIRRFFQTGKKQEIRAVDLKACERCGALFAPVPQMEKVGKTFENDYLRFCPICRKANIGDYIKTLSPWHNKSKSSNKQAA
ncbi:MAG TPA: 4Fe-4S binding protein [Desulfobacteraceae bacterium]|nr:4Fe-4S binding protein [Desulfobacteraceae bacterium]HPJ67112.1 4Fe-4S binding protein [Desulfobacteraceae bacterium]HPQ28361.1 4Fe-4S binding protein [Desulfobacteraceae bacterium]